MLLLIDGSFEVTSSVDSSLKLTGAIEEVSSFDEMKLEEAEEQPELYGRDGEQVHGRGTVHVVAQEGEPTLARSGAGGSRGMYRDTDASDMMKPSFFNSPCILGAPQAFPRAISRMCLRTSAFAGACPGPRFCREILVQCRRKRRRCHPRDENPPFLVVR